MTDFILFLQEALLEDGKTLMDEERKIYIQFTNDTDIIKRKRYGNDYPFLLPLHLVW